MFYRVLLFILLLLINLDGINSISIDSSRYYSFKKKSDTDCTIHSICDVRSLQSSKLFKAEEIQNVRRPPEIMEQ